MAITLSGDWTVTLPNGTTNYSDKLELSGLAYDKKNSKVILSFETHDGADYTGTLTEMTITSEPDATAKKLDGTTITISGVTFADVAVGNTIDLSACELCITANYTADA